MQQSIKCCYISYEKAHLEIREKVAFSQEEILRFLLFLKDLNFASEFMVLSTCNRTEIYYVADKDLKDKFIRSVSGFKGNPEILRYKSFFASEVNPEKTISRLFEIGNGLHSQVLGDLQIIAQVKHAYKQVCEAGTAGAYLHRLLQTLFSCYKAVASNTDIHSGSASVSYAAIEIVRDFLKKDKEKPVLLIGAGAFSKEVIGQLRKKDISNISIANRSKEKAQCLADKYNLKLVPFDEIDDLWCYDVVISCIAAQEIIVKKEQFEVSTRKSKLLIDLSVPRSIDPELAAVSGIKLINMNQISEKNDAALIKRQKSVPEALQIIAAFHQKFRMWEMATSQRHVHYTFMKQAQEAGIVEKLLARLNYVQI